MPENGKPLVVVEGYPAECGRDGIQTVWGSPGVILDQQHGPRGCRNLREGPPGDVLGDGVGMQHRRSRLWVSVRHGFRVVRAASNLRRSGVREQLQRPVAGDSIAVRRKQHDVRILHRQPLAVLLRVGQERLPQLSLVAEAGRPAGVLADFSEDRKKKRRQCAHDGDDDKKFNQREAWAFHGSFLMIMPPPPTPPPQAGEGSRNEKTGSFLTGSFLI
jgi:hypothetical protein